MFPNFSNSTSTNPFKSLFSGFNNQAAQVSALNSFGSMFRPISASTPMMSRLPSTAIPQTIAAPKPAVPTAQTTPTAQPATPTSPALPQNGAGTGLAAQGQAGGFNLQNIISQFDQLTPEQKQFFGIGETEEQKTQREALSSSINRLTNFYEQLAAAKVPSETLQEVDRLIADQTKQLKNLTPESLLKTTGFQNAGISQAGLEREVATRREPIAAALSDLLTSKSILGQQQQGEIERIQTQIQGMGQEFQLRDALSKLSVQGKGLPDAVKSALLTQAINPDTQVVEANGRKLLINANTGQLVRDIGAAGTTGGDSGLSLAVLQNPQLFSQLTPAIKASLIPSLSTAGFKFPRELSAEQQKAATNAESALLALTNAENKIFDENGNVKYGQLTLATTGFGDLAFQLREAADVLTRVRTGAALNESEQSFYAKQVPRVVDDKKTIVNKLNQLKALYAGIGGTPITVQLPDGGIVSSDDMFDPEDRRAIRDAISKGGIVISTI